MESNPRIIDRTKLRLGLVLAVIGLVWWSVAAQAANKRHEPDSPVHMEQIKTRAEAEALRPGDLIAMACSMCKNVILHTVTEENAHVKMMTIGHKHTCPDCDGKVEVVGTGNGNGDNEEVEHVCSKCGADAMFVCAAKPGSGGGQHHQPGPHHGDGDHSGKGKHRH